MAPDNPTDATRHPYATGHLSNVAQAMRELAHPTQIGPYAILEVVGEGGMGTVYKAEQRAPIRRTVALKIIKLGMDTRDVIARFESERQALAMMNHPNVARVLDAGATDTGRPYFVMEYVAGQPITAFADHHRLTIRQRLELFLQACEAVQHAHQKAIIHRDLKPSNILVTMQDDVPCVKVIDFGVAKATGGRLTDKTLYTQTGQIVGTPEYMAPEQADTQDVDTRTDVYSLGVVLYELLSGSLPFDASTLRSAGQLEIQRIIRDVVPPRPSTRLSGMGKGADEVARRRGTAVEVLAKELRGELEWIPLNAMRKERSQRYATAVELAEDIRNYLENRPLRAGPESQLYRARKFLRRNVAWVSAATAMGLLLIAGAAATGWQAIRATRAEHLALAQKREAEIQRQAAVDASASLREVNRFLTEDLLGAAAPEVARGREITVRQAVDLAAQNVAERFKEYPLNEAAVRVSLAETYYSLGLFDVGLVHANTALELLRNHRGEDHRSTIAAQATVGRLLASLNRYAESETVLRETYERAKRILGPEDEVTLHCLSDLAIAIRRQRRFAEAEPLYRIVSEIVPRVYGVDSEENALALNGLSNVLAEQDRDAEALPYLRQSLDILRRFGIDNISYQTTIGNYGKMLQRLGRLDEAEAAAREAVAGRRKVLSDDHPQTLLSINDLAWILAEKGEAEEAEALARESLERRRRVLGDGDRDTLQSMNALGRMLTMFGRYDEAEKMLKDTVAGRNIALGETHAHTLGSMTHLATVYELQHRYADAEPLLAHACRPEFIPILGTVQRRAVYARWGICLAELERFSEAEPILAQSHRELSDGGDDGDLADRVRAALARTYQSLGRPEDAARFAVSSTRPTTAPAKSP